MDSFAPVYILLGAVYIVTGYVSARVFYMMGVRRANALPSTVKRKFDELEERVKRLEAPGTDDDDAGFEDVKMPGWTWGEAEPRGDGKDA